VELYAQLVSLYPETSCTIGIIAPYQAQRKVLTNLLLEKYGPIVFRSVEVSTIDGFQGREKDVIIFSCVRAPSYSISKSTVTTTVRPHQHHSSTTSNSWTERREKGGGIGFLKEPQRLNVAITRAKYSLWIIGHLQTLHQADHEWRQIIDNMNKRK